tara:strand:+ start:789 stop:1148 length:360 start_codon:yes stop_codon:yes gene_type:complete
LIQIIKKRTGIPISAVTKKKFGYPIISTHAPAYPAINFGKKSIIELNRAYWVAVNFSDVNPDKYITKAAPANPLEILSAVMTAIKKFILMGEIANQANNILLIAAIRAPKNKALIVPIL